MTYIKYTKELVEEAVANSTSVRGVMAYLGLAQDGGNHTHMSNRIKKYGIDTSHFTGKGWNKGGKSLNRRTPKEILVVLPEGSNRPQAARLRRAMKESGVEPRCKCGLTDMWQGNFLQLEVNHIDGNWLNNLIENLEFICPNCHSQESHTNKPHKYRGK